MKVENYIEFELNDFYINSGILGFYKILEENEQLKNKVLIEKNKLKIDMDSILNADLTDLYFKALFRKYKSDCNINRVIIELQDSIKNYNESNIDKTITDVYKSLKYSRYKTAFDTIKSELDFDFWEDLNLYTNTSKENYLKTANKLLNDLKNKTLNEIFTIKDIIYFYIINFWDNVSFLNMQKANENPKNEFKNFFEEPLKQYLRSTQTKNTLYCAQCENAITSKFKKKYAFVCGLGEDVDKKNSNYYNFKKSYICPICNFLYACIPLGFMCSTDSDKRFIFVNDNSNLNSLIQSNNEKSEQKLYNIYYDIIKKLFDCNLYSLEIITKDAKNNYIIDIIDKSIIKKIQQKEKKINSLAKWNTITDNYIFINPFEEVLKCIINNKSTFNLINNLFMLTLNKDDNSRGICNIIYEIEIEDSNIYYDIIQKSKEMAISLLETDNKVLLERKMYDICLHIKNNEFDKIMDTVLNISILTQKNISEQTANILSNDKKEATKIAYSLLIGFNKAFEYK